MLNSIQKLAKDPTHLSRTIIASFLIVAMTGLLLNLETGSAGFLQSQALGSGEPAAAPPPESPPAPYSHGNIASESLDDCLAHRDDGDGAKFLANFEEAFSGVLPGVSGLLDQSSIVERKQALALEVVKIYAQLEYCLPEDTIQISSEGKINTNNLASSLDTYLVARAMEQNPALQVNGVSGVAITEASSVLNNVKNELNTMINSVESKIENSVKQAEVLDGKIESKIEELSLQSKIDANRSQNQWEEKIKQLQKVGDDIGKNIDVSSWSSTTLSNTSDPTSMTVYGKVPGIPYGAILSYASLIQGEIWKIQKKYALITKFFREALAILFGTTLSIDMAASYSQSILASCQASAGAAAGVSNASGQTKIILADASGNPVDQNGNPTSSPIEIKLDANGQPALDQTRTVSDGTKLITVGNPILLVDGREKKLPSDARGFVIGADGSVLRFFTTVTDFQNQNATPNPELENLQNLRQKIYAEQAGQLRDTARSISFLEEGNAMEVAKVITEVRPDITLKPNENCSGKNTNTHACRYYIESDPDINYLRAILENASADLPADPDRYPVAYDKEIALENMFKSSWTMKANYLASGISFRQMDVELTPDGLKLPEWYTNPPPDRDIFYNRGLRGTEQGPNGKWGTEASDKIPLTVERLRGGGYGGDKRFAEIIGLKGKPDMLKLSQAQLERLGIFTLEWMEKKLTRLRHQLLIQKNVIQQRYHSEIGKCPDGIVECGIHQPTDDPTLLPTVTTTEEEITVPVDDGNGGTTEQTLTILKIDTVTPFVMPWVDIFYISNTHYQLGVAIEDVERQLNIINDILNKDNGKVGKQINFYETLNDTHALLTSAIDTEAQGAATKMGDQKTNTVIQQRLSVAAGLGKRKTNIFSGGIANFIQSDQRETAYGSLTLSSTLKESLQKSMIDYVSAIKIGIDPKSPFLGEDGIYPIGQAIFRPDIKEKELCRSLDGQPDYPTCFGYNKTDDKMDTDLLAAAGKAMTNIDLQLALGTNSPTCQ